MQSIFGLERITIPCECGKKHQKTIAWLKTHDHFRCACGAELRLDVRKFRRQLADIDRAAADVQRTFDKLGQMFKGR